MNALRDYGVNGQIGLERTPAEYVAALVAVFEEARRVLRDDGVMWVNLGDTYAGGGNYRGINEETLSPKQASNGGAHGIPQNVGALNTGLPPKSLLGVPWRVAFALQDAGWILRSEIIWAKPNPMPESVTDRPTKAHETVFLLAKRERYFYDGEAIREEALSSDPEHEHYRANGKSDSRVKHIGVEGGIKPAFGNDGLKVFNSRNKRTVWTVPTEPTPFAHFATFPQKLIEPMILAGCPAKCCAVCGAGCVRVVEFYGESKADKRKARGYTEKRNSGGILVRQNLDYAGSHRNDTRIVHTLGFRPTCTCNADTRPGVVLDIFGGSGTVGLVARRLGRSFILSDLNPDYCELARKRLAHNVDSEVQKQEKGEWFTMPMFGDGAT